MHAKQTAILAYLEQAGPKGARFGDICTKLNIKSANVAYHLDSLCQSGKAHLLRKGWYAVGPEREPAITAAPSATLVKPTPQGPITPVFVGTIPDLNEPLGLPVPVREGPPPPEGPPPAFIGPHLSPRARVPIPAFTDPDPIATETPAGQLDVMARAFRTDIKVSTGYITLIVPDRVTAHDLKLVINALNTLLGKQ